MRNRRRRRPEAPARLWVNDDLWRELLVHADGAHPNETGGVLLGWRDRADTVVTHLLGPGPNAWHGKTWFHPDGQWQASRIAELYEQSGRRLSYLGDWHTHPDGVPTPSRQDRATLARISRTAEARCPSPLMLILGGPDSEGQWSSQCVAWIPKALPLLHTVHSVHVLVS